MVSGLICRVFARVDVVRADLDLIINVVEQCPASLNPCRSKRSFNSARYGIRFNCFVLSALYVLEHNSIKSTALNDEPQMSVKHKHSHHRRTSAL